MNPLLVKEEEKGQLAAGFVCNHTDFEENVWLQHVTQNRRLCTSISWDRCVGEGQLDQRLQIETPAHCITRNITFISHIIQVRQVANKCDIASKDSVQEFILQPLIVTCIIFLLQQLFRCFEVGKWPTTLKECLVIYKVSVDFFGQQRRRLSPSWHRSQHYYHHFD